MSRGGAFRPLFLAAALLLAFWSAAGADTPAGAKPKDLEEARSRLASASSPADYAAMLEACSSALPPPDALALLNQGIAGAGQEYRKAFLVKAADLSLLLGLFGEAASSYEAAAYSPTANSRAGKADAGLLLRAARCALAAGDADKASVLSAGPIIAAGDPDLAAAARLVGAWALLMRNRPSDASALAQAVAASSGAASPSAERGREARFLLWLCAEAGAKAEAAAKLASEFPGSPEALMAAGSVSVPPLPHWYLGGIGAAPAPASGPPRAAAAKPAPPPAVGASPPPAAPRGKRLQVGYFSREENAEALGTELRSKGFAAAVETLMRTRGPNQAAEKRWIVIVEGGKDLAATLQSLKDAGYESYTIE